MAEPWFIVQAEIPIAAISAAAYLGLSIAGIVQYIRVKNHIDLEGLKPNQLFARQVLCWLISTGSFGNC